MTYFVTLILRRDTNSICTDSHTAIIDNNSTHTGICDYPSKSAYTIMTNTFIDRLGQLCTDG